MSEKEIGDHITDEELAEANLTRAELQEWIVALWNDINENHSLSLPE